MTEFTDLKAVSANAWHINAGASARLNLQPMVSELSGEAHAAFCHGWSSTDEAENRAGRTMPVGCSVCGKDHPEAFCPVTEYVGRADPFYKDATSMVGGA